jgi:hypothetical protein
MDSEFKNNQAVEQQIYEAQEDEGDISNKKLADQMMRKQIREHKSL